MRYGVTFLSLIAALVTSSISGADQHRTWLDLVGPNASGVKSEQIRLFAANAITIVNERQEPIAGATILIGSAVDQPFPGNLVTTGADGTASIPADWKSALPVTVQAPGYITTTVPLAEPADRVLRLNKAEGTGEIEVKGTATDFGRLISDGKVDFSLLMNSLNRAELLSFNMSTVLSPKIDPIELLGNRVPLPSNVTLPRQVESFILPVELNKPDFRLYFREVGQYLVSALHGQFPMQRVINEIRAGKSIFDLLNQFNILERGQTTFDVTGNLTGANMPVNQLKFDRQISVKAPAYANGEVMYAVALDEQGPIMSPTDVKRFNKNETINLKSHNGTNPSVLAVLAPSAGAAVNLIDLIVPNMGNAPGAKAGERPQQDFTQSSLALLPAGGGAAPQFLPLIAKPVFANNVITATPPALPEGLTAASMYLVFSEIEPIEGGSVKNERRTRLWEIWSDVWAPEVQIPVIEFARNPDRIYRWEVMFLARATGAAAGIDASDLNTVTHVTRNAVDL